MAGTTRTRRKPAEAAETSLPASLADSLSLTPSEGVKRASKPTAVIPPVITDGLALSLQEGPQAFTVADEAAAKQVSLWLRNAATRSDVGLSMSQTTNEDGTVTVDFCGKAEKVQRAYTSAQIRDWATEVGYDREYLYPKINPAVRKQFRQVHGFEKAPESDEN